MLLLQYIVLCSSRDATTELYISGCYSHGKRDCSRQEMNFKNIKVSISISASRFIVIVDPTLSCICLYLPRCLQSFDTTFSIFNISIPLLPSAYIIHITYHTAICTGYCDKPILNTLQYALNHVCVILVYFVAKFCSVPYRSVLLLCTFVICLLLDSEISFNLT